MRDSGVTITDKQRVINLVSGAFRALSYLYMDKGIAPNVRRQVGQQLLHATSVAATKSGDLPEHNTFYMIGEKAAQHTVDPEVKDQRMTWVAQFMKEYRYDYNIQNGFRDCYIEMQNDAPLDNQKRPLAEILEQVGDLLSENPAETIVPRLSPKVAQQYLAGAVATTR